MDEVINAATFNSIIAQLEEQGDLAPVNPSVQLEVLEAKYKDEVDTE